MKNEQSLKSNPAMSMEDGIKMVQLLTQQLKKTDPQNSPDEYERIQNRLQELNEQGFEVPFPEQIQ